MVHSGLNQSMRRLPKPDQQDLRNARVTFEHKDQLRVFRLRSSANSATDGQNHTVAGGYCVAAAWKTGGLSAPDIPTTLSDERGSGVIVPTGANPTDATDVNLLRPDPYPAGFAKYQDMYGRYLVESQRFKFDYINYEAFDVVVGVLFIPLGVYLNENDFVLATALGIVDSAATFLPQTGVRLDYLKKMPGVTTKIVKAADFSNLAANQLGATTGTADANDGRYVHEQGLQRGTRGSIGISIQNANIHAQLASMAGGKFDLGSHSGVFTGTIGNPQNSGIVWMFVVPASGFYTDYEGDDAEGTYQHRRNVIETENWGSAICHDWTSRFCVRPTVTSQVVLYDPIVSTPTKAYPSLILDI